VRGPAGRPSSDEIAPGGRTRREILSWVTAAVVVLCSIGLRVTGIGWDGFTGLNPDVRLRKLLLPALPAPDGE